MPQNGGMQQATAHDIDDLDRPRPIPDLVEFLRGRGERVSRGTLYAWIKAGLIPAARVGRMTSTARAYYRARTPGAAAGQ